MKYKFFLHKSSCDDSVWKNPVALEGSAVCQSPHSSPSFYFRIISKHFLIESFKPFVYFLFLPDLLHKRIIAQLWFRRRISQRIHQSFERSSTKLASHGIKKLNFLNFFSPDSLHFQAWSQSYEIPGNAVQATTVDDSGARLCRQFVILLDHLTHPVHFPGYVDVVRSVRTTQPNHVRSEQVKRTRRVQYYFRVANLFTL